MKTQISYFKSTGIPNYFSKLILVTALGLYASASAYAEDNQGAQASAITVVMVTVKDTKKNSNEKRKDYFNEKSSTYVSNYICE